MITFAGDGPQVERLVLNDDGTLNYPLDLADTGGKAILIVSAWAPMTLQPAGYRLSFLDS